MQYNDETIKALARLREVAREGAIGMFAGIARDLNILDNAGVFAALDEQTDYASAVDVLAEAAVAASRLDPAEWGDTTSADVARRQGLDEPLYGAAADRVRDELDAGDRAAMGRLARRALTQPDRRAHGLD